MEGVAAGARCPSCGLTTLDPLDPAQRDAVDSARLLHDRRRFNPGVLIAIGILVALAPFVVMALPPGDKRAQLVPLVAVLAVLGLVAWSSLRHRAWRIPDEANRRWATVTSTTMIAFAICTAFVAIERSVGVEALWYARGLEPWRIVTASFTHGSAAHFIGNMIALWLFGLAIDRRVGRLWTAVVLAAGAVVGALAQAWWSPEPGVGFSGAIYGLIGATLVLMPTRPQLISMQAVVVPLPTWAWTIVIVTLYTTITAFDPHTNIAWMAHLGGFVGGLAVAVPMRRVRPSAAFAAFEQRRAARLTALAQNSGALVIEPPADDATPASARSSDPDIARFVDAARRRSLRISIIGALVFLVLGGAIAGLSVWLEADYMSRGRRITAITAGLVMFVTGLAMLGQGLRSVRRRPRP